jgi:hypothetical protein
MYMWLPLYLVEGLGYTTLQVSFLCDSEKILYFSIGFYNGNIPTFFRLAACPLPLMLVEFWAVLSLASCWVQHFTTFFHTDLHSLTALKGQSHQIRFSWKLLYMEHWPRWGHTMLINSLFYWGVFSVSTGCSPVVGSGQFLIYTPQSLTNEIS